MGKQDYGRFHSPRQRQPDAVVFGLAGVRDEDSLQHEGEGARPIDEQGSVGVQKCVVQYSVAPQDGAQTGARAFFSNSFPEKIDSGLLDNFSCFDDQS